MKIFYDRFPWLMRIFEFGRFSDLHIDKFFRRDFIKEIPSEKFFRECYHILREYGSNNNEYLSEEDVVAWFGKDLDSRIVNFDDIEFDNRRIKDAIEQGDDFLIIIKNGTFRSAVAICKVTRNISSKVLTNIIK